MQIGDYFLGQNISGNSQLTELSKQVYLVLPKMFDNENILRAPDVTFLGYSWNIFLGVMDNRIYKISAQSITDNVHMADMIYSRAMEFCSKQYGIPSSKKDLPPSLRTLYEKYGWTESEINRVLLWNTAFGNVIIDHKSAFDNYYVNFQVTSGPLVREPCLLPSRTTPTKNILTLIFLLLAAYAFSFAADMLFGALFNGYPKSAFLPAITWGVISIAAFSVAMNISTLRKWFSIPFAVFGTFALFGAFIGTHPHSFAVAVLMFFSAAFIWRVAQRTSGFSSK
jgi:hypothetical protein